VADQIDEAAVDDQEAGEDQEHAEDIVGFEGFAEDGAGEKQGADRDHQGDEQSVRGAGGGDDAKINDVGHAGAENAEHGQCQPGERLESHKDRGFSKKQAGQQKNQGADKADGGYHHRWQVPETPGIDAGQSVVESAAENSQLRHACQNDAARQRRPDHRDDAGDAGQNTGHLAPGQLLVIGEKVRQNHHENR